MSEIEDLEVYLNEVIEELERRKKKLVLIDDEITMLKSQSSHVSVVDVIAMKNSNLRRKEMKQVISNKVSARKIAHEDVQSAEARKSSIESEIRMLKNTDTDNR